MVEAVDGISVGITPSGNIDIIQAGQTNVTNYATATVAAGTAGTPVAAKGPVSSHSITIAPSVTNTAGYISGGTLTGTAITVSASELVSGTYTVASAGTANVTNYATATVPSGALVSTLLTSVTPAISVDDDGQVVASAEDYASESVVYQAGWMNTNSTLFVYKTAYAQEQLPTQAATTITPSTTAQTAVAKGKWTTGAVTVAAMPAGTAGTPTASKGTVSNHSITITPSVTNTTGYITGSSITGIAVTVSASELVSGTYTVNSSGTKDVTNYASVSVPGGTATTPATTITATPSISINSSGLITATNSKTQSVSPTISAGYISSGTSGTITVNGSNTSQLTTQAATTITPTESSQQAVASGVYTTGAITVGAISSSYVGSGITRRDETDLSASGATVTVPAGYYAEAETKSVAAGTVNSPVATKGTVSNNQISITPSVVVSSGYVSGDTLTGTAVTVSASELVSGTKTITENGTNIDVTNYASVNVNIPSSITIEETADPGGGTVVTITGEQISPSDIPDQIFFIDYDGTILYSYKVREFNQLTELPANPSHTGLVAQGWNWTLAQIQSQLQDTPDQDIWVGQVYTTASGATEIDVTIVSPYLSPNLAICPNGTITVDWGDETTPDEITGTSNTVIKYIHHQYASAGNYTIKIAGATSSDKYGFNYTGGSNFKGPLTAYNSDSSLSEIYSPTSSLYSSNISAIRFGDGLSKIGQYVFQYSHFSYVILPSSIQSIDSNSFQYNTRLKAIIFPSGFLTIGSTAFNHCGQLQFLSVPSSIQTMGSNCFFDCPQLKSVTLPSTLQTIGSSAFDTTSLKKVFLPSSLTDMQGTVFRGTQLTTLTIPSSVTTISSSLFYGLTFLQSYSYPRSASVNTDGMFYDCKLLSEFILPNTITEFGANMFRNTRAVSITIPSGVTSIGNYCFYNCNFLETLTIPSSVTSIGAECFRYCYNLTNLDISSTTVTTLGTNVFANCTSLSSITLPDTVTSLGNTCFQYCYSLTTLTIPASVTSLGNSCFTNCAIMKEYHFLRTTPPTLGTTVFANISSQCKIYVPYSADHSILNAYKTATNWSTYASYIVEESQ